MGRIAKCGNEIKEARGSTAIFRWASALPGNQYFGGRPGVCLEFRFNDDVVPPVVAKIVAILKFSLSTQRVGERHASLVGERRTIAREIVNVVRPTVLERPDPAFVQVLVLPAKRTLNRIVQVCKRQVGDHDEPAPYARLDIAQRNLELKSRCSD